LTIFFKNDTFSAELEARDAQIRQERGQEREAEERRRDEAVERHRREQEEERRRERRREAQEESDEEFRNNFQEHLNNMRFTIVGRAPEPSRPTRSAVRAAMKPSTQVIDADNLCSICLTPEERTVIELKCGHPFHRRCAKRWLRSRLICPLCNCACE
jgi:hypothetical protein